MTDPNPPNAEVIDFPTAEEPSGLNAWVDYLTQEGLPAFARTAAGVSELTADQDSSIAELSRLILQDTAMTTRLLRLANSPVYGQFSGAITTVTRAVIVLGFDAVRDLCLSLALIEDLGNHLQSEQVLPLIAESFHAAIQARGLAELARDPAPEEVFVATLLSRIGELAFWCLAGPQGHALRQAMARDPGDPKSAQREVLGFTLEQLTHQLTQGWRLGGLLREAQERHPREAARVRHVQHGRHLASLATQGWRHPAMLELMAEIADGADEDFETVQQRIEHQAEEAVRRIGHFGAPQASALIPLPDNARAGAEDDTEVLADNARHYPEPDPQLQLTILQEITSQLGGGCDLGNLLGMVLEGINRGIGMDRTLFALISPDHHELRARHALGPDAAELKQQFVIHPRPGQPSLFMELMRRGQPLWLNSTRRDQFAALIDPVTAAIIGDAECLAAPIQVRGKGIGLLYADRRPSGRGIAESDFNAFRHFAQQAGLVLSQPHHRA